MRTICFRDSRTIAQYFLDTVVPDWTKEQVHFYLKYDPKNIPASLEYSEKQIAYHNAEENDPNALLHRHSFTKFHYIDCFKHRCTLDSMVEESEIAKKHLESEPIYIMGTHPNKTLEAGKFMLISSPSYWPMNALTNIPHEFPDDCEDLYGIYPELNIEEGWPIEKFFEQNFATHEKILFSLLSSRLV